MGDLLRTSCEEERAGAPNMKDTPVGHVGTRARVEARATLEQAEELVRATRGSWQEAATHRIVILQAGARWVRVASGVGLV